MVLSRKEELFQWLQNELTGRSAAEIATELGIERSNASRYLNDLVRSGRVTKLPGRPVRYQVRLPENTPPEYTHVHVDQATSATFATLVGEQDSLKVPIQQAQAAVLYPPHGLDTLIFGETGTGKSLFAECMYQFAVEQKVLSTTAPFITFNCADYAQNPQLLFAHIFGVKKGAFTGAEQDQPGLIAQADQGILFLDEIHRLPPEGQEMLFTFIDKGTYRPLGETTKTEQASVQIIGATTETSDQFLATFTRRIPMAITMPPLRERTIDERYQIVARFLNQEANRLQQIVTIDREVMLAFMLYEARHNIGQIKRDLKMVCARAFLNYRSGTDETLWIRAKDLPLHVQKGLLKTKEHAAKFAHLLQGEHQALTFEPGTKEAVWTTDTTRDMDVYNDIEASLSEIKPQVLSHQTVNQVVSFEVEQSFQDYVDELTEQTALPTFDQEHFTELSNQVYDQASQRLERSYPAQIRFTFGLHLQAIVARIQQGQTIQHPNLNQIRKQYPNEFQAAIEGSAVIEKSLGVDIPFDEIGYIALFLSKEVFHVEPGTQTSNVQVVVLMHGQSTASSMLETAQQLLGTERGHALNMPLSKTVQEMYQEVRDFVQQLEEPEQGVLLLTDMGSLNTFGQLLSEEIGIRTKTLAHVSTMTVMEALRLSELGSSLEECAQTLTQSLKEVLGPQFSQPFPKKSAIVITCFTGEGVAARLHDEIRQLIDPTTIEIRVLQFLDKPAFQAHIDELLSQFAIKAIVGTVSLHYQSIPFFSAYDLFDVDKRQLFLRVVAEEITIEQMTRSLEGHVQHVPSVSKLLLDLKETVQGIQQEMLVAVEPSVKAGIVIHLAFLIERYRSGQAEARSVQDWQTVLKKHRFEMDIVQTHVMALEQTYQVQLPQSEAALVTQMFLQNRLDQNLTHLI